MRRRKKNHPSRSRTTNTKRLARFAWFSLTLLLSSGIASADSPTKAEKSQKLVASKADREAAKEVYKRGATAYQEDRYTDAADAFEKAFTLDPRKSYLFAWAQSERLAGKCMQAVVLYNRLLRRTPTADQADLIAQGLGECEPKLTKAEKQEIKKLLGEMDQPKTIKERVIVTRPGKTEVKRVVVTKRETTTSRVPSYFFLGAGVAGLGTGTYFFLQARKSNNAVAVSFEDRLDKADKAESQQLYSILSFAAGGALLATGVIWFALAGGSSDEAATQASVFPTDDGVGFALAGRF